MKIHFTAALALTTALGLAGSGVSHAGTPYYVDSVGGADGNDGLTEATAWKNLYRANQHALGPGDSLLFKRGGQWRGTLQLRGGSAAGGVVTYGAYGTGEKPKLLGSATLNNTNDWVESSPDSGIWISRSVPIDAANKVVNAEFTTGTVGWGVWNPKDILSLSQDVGNSADPSAQIRFKRGVAVADTTGDAQLYAQVGAIAAGQCYRLSFKAMASAPFAPKGAIALILEHGNPGNSLGTILNQPAMPTIGTSWDDYSVLFRAVNSVAYARVAFQLGASAATDATLNFDSVSFRTVECDRVVFADVGNLILNGGAAVGVKVLNQADLDEDGKFWFDPKKLQVHLKSYQHPAALYGQIEAAQNFNIVAPRTDASRTDLVLRDLDLRYGGAHAVAFGPGTARTTVERLEISYIGGSYLGSSLYAADTRYGNGIQFWGMASDATVRDNRLSHIYDSALTAQGQTDTSAATVFNHITFSRNYIWDVEQCYELWNQGTVTGSTSTNIYFTWNTCVNAGHGWSHVQRKGKAGVGVLMYAAVAPMRNIFITDNIFATPTEAVVLFDLPWNGYRDIDFGRNCFYVDPNAPPGSSLLLREQGTGNMATKNPADFISEFSTAATSYFDDPELYALSNGELAPAVGKACENMGHLSPLATSASLATIPSR